MILNLGLPASTEIQEAKFGPSAIRALLFPLSDLRLLEGNIKIRCLEGCDSSQRLGNPSWDCLGFQNCGKQHF